jgi:L-cysteine desulfidase
MVTGPAGPPDVDPLAWAVVAGLALGVVTMLALLVSGRFTPVSVALVFLVPAIAGCVCWLAWALRRR